MSTVVQATCPGCRNVLRIPSELLAQPIRCKHCQTVMMPRQAATQATPPTPAAPPRPPLAPTANYPQPAAPRQPAGRVAPPPVPGAPVPPAVPTPAPPPLPATAAQPAAVAVAEPGKKKKKKERPTAFDDFHEEDTATEQTLRKARKPRGMLVPLIVIGLLMAGGTTLAVVFWPQIRALMNNEPIVFNQEDPGTPPPGEGPRPSTGTPSTTTTQTRDKGGNPRTIPATGSGFPRRALIISVHNYLYANLIHSGPPGPGSLSLPNLVNDLNRLFRIPLNQIAHLSDTASRGASRPPLKSVIEKTLTDFLDSSRAQDRVMIFLIGHSVEIDEKVYFVPIEGELEMAETLIPMAWILEKVGACKAKQKVLVVDVNRENLAYGRERPASGSMGEKLEAMLKAPPEGVQIWSACSKEGYSYETSEYEMGVFLGTLLEVAKEGLQGKIQKESESYPLEMIHEKTNRKLKEGLDPLGLKQVAFLAGAEKDNGSEYDPKEALASEPVLAPLPPQQGGPATAAAIKSVLEEVAVPAVKVTKADNKINAALLPPMADAMKDYPAGGDPTPIRQKVREARALLWAIHETSDIPPDLKDMVMAKKAELKVSLSVLKDGYKIPTNENQFKMGVEGDQRQVAVILGALQEMHEEMKEMAEDKEKETKRWQVNFDFVMSRLEAQIAYIYEYQSMLGQIRKELPTHDPKIHKSFQLASRTELTGDSAGKRMAKNSNKTLTTMTEEAKNTPWEILAKREKLTSLGLEWIAVR